MVTLINRMEISFTPQFLRDRGLTLASLFNPLKLQENLHQLLSDVPGELRPRCADLSIGRMNDGVHLSYELNRTPLGNAAQTEEFAELALDINGELDVETALDQAIFTVAENRYCRKQTLTFTDTPVSFVREYLENETCGFYIRVLNSHVFEVTITPKID